MNIDYSKPTETACCLSRGSVINYAKVKRGDVCLYLGLETDVNQLAEKVGDEGSVFVVEGYFRHFVFIYLLMLNSLQAIKIRV